MTKGIEEPISIARRPKKKRYPKVWKKERKEIGEKKIKKSHEGATSFEFWFVVNFLARNYIRTVHTNALLSLVVTLLRTLSQLARKRTDGHTYIYMYIYIYIHTTYTKEARTHARTHVPKQTYSRRMHAMSLSVAHTYTKHTRRIAYIHNTRAIVYTQK